MPLRCKGVRQHRRWGFGQVVSSGLEGQAQNSDPHSPEIFAELAAQNPERQLPLSLVDADDGAKQFGTVARLPCNVPKGADILGEARAAVANSGEYSGTGPGVQGQTLSDIVDELLWGGHSA